MNLIKTQLDDLQTETELYEEELNELYELGWNILHYNISNKEINHAADSSLCELESQTDKSPDSAQILYTKKAMENFEYGVNYDKQDEPINMYDICILESICKFVEQFKTNSFPLINDDLSEFLETDSLVIKCGFRNSDEDVSESIGKMIIQGYLTIKNYINESPRRRELTPTEKSRLLLPYEYFDELRNQENNR